MATLPPGTLMQRAAAGLARRCALLLAEPDRAACTAPACSCSSAAATTAATRSTPARASPAGAPHVTALLLAPAKAHRDGLAALRRAGGRVVDAPPSTVDLVRRRHRRHRRQGRPAPGRREGASRPRDREAARPSWSPSTCPAGSTSTPAPRPAPHVTADVTVTFGCLKPAHVVGPAAAAGRPRRARRHRPAARGSRPRRRVRVPERDRHRRTLAQAAARLGEVQPRGGRHRDRLGHVPRRRRPGRRRRARRPGRDGPVRGQRPRRGPPPAPVGDRHRAGRRRRPGTGLGLRLRASARTRRARAELRSVLAAPVPAVLDADALTLLVDGSMAAPAAGPRRADRAHPARPGVRPPRGGGAGRRPGRGGAAARRTDERGGPAQGRPHDRRHAGRAGVRQPDRHLGAGHRRHR